MLVDGEIKVKITIEYKFKGRKSAENERKEKYLY